MTPAKIKKLFKLQDCVLVGFDGTRWVDLMTGPFNMILAQYYCCSPWKYFFIRLPNGAHYPKDYLKETNARH